MLITMISNISDIWQQYCVESWDTRY